MANTFPVMNVLPAVSNDRNMPPFMYISPELGEHVRPRLKRLVKRAGLAPLRIEGGSYRLVPVPGLTTTVDSRRRVEVFTSNDVLLAHNVTITDPPTWCDLALDYGYVLVAVGPYVVWPFEGVDFLWMLDRVAYAGAYVGLAETRPRF